jgi:hypothetical protein
MWKPKVELGMKAISTDQGSFFMVLRHPGLFVKRFACPSAVVTAACNEEKGLKLQ